MTAPAPTETSRLPRLCVHVYVTRRGVRKLELTCDSSEKAETERIRLIGASDVEDVEIDQRHFCWCPQR